MKCFKICVVLTLVFSLSVTASDIKFKEIADEIQVLRTMHLSDVTRLQTEIEQLKLNCEGKLTSNYEQNEQATLHWARSAVKELRVGLRELSASLNSSVLLRQLHVIRNQLKQALTETTDLAQMARTQEARVDKLESETGRLKYENQQMRTTVADLRTHLGKLAKEMKTTQLEEVNEEYNNVVPSEPKHAHKLRHNKMVHVQMSRLARAQDQLDAYQQSLQNQLLDAQRRIDRYEEPNWSLLSAKVDILAQENKVLRDQLMNTTQKVSDLDKVHASMLELREDVESIENKADNTIPEFRKEISKLDISFAQLQAQSSYLKEDQENLRQSVKAIAVSVSNAIDRAELDRLALQRVNESVADLDARAKQHYHRLNDHILKTESNNQDAQTETITLPELMGEVKQLQPVEREYEDLVNQLPKDCSSIAGPPGTYLIHPGRAPFDTWCVNGSTLVQRRYNGSIEFNRKFKEYVHGFGDPAAEYWLGLDSIHLLTADNCSSMRIDMTDIYGGHWYAQYEHFFVGSADTGYVLEVSGFKGNASDAFEYQNHMEFSTVDRDRDISNTNCAANYEGGWWFSHCQHVNINGKYNLGLTWFDSVRNEWIAVETTDMRMYRRPGCS